MILTLALLALLLAALYAGMTFANLRAYRPPPPPGTDLPQVSVLIPARDDVLLVHAPGPVDRVPLGCGIRPGRRGIRRRRSCCRWQNSVGENYVQHRNL